MAKISLYLALALVAGVAIVSAGKPKRFCKTEGNLGCRGGETCCDYPAELLPNRARERLQNGACCKTSQGERCPRLPDEVTCMKVPKETPPPQPKSAGVPARFCKQAEDGKAADGCRDKETCCDFPIGLVPLKARADGKNGACCKTGGRERCPRLPDDENTCMLLLPGESPAPPPPPPPPKSKSAGAPGRFCKKAEEGKDADGCRDGETCCDYQIELVPLRARTRGQNGACCKTGGGERCPRIPDEVTCMIDPKEGDDYDDY